MSTYSIRLSDEVILAIKASDDRILGLLARDVLADKSTLSRLLDHYCQDDLGTVDSGAIEIDEERSSIDEKNSGFLLMCFQEEAYYGCRDMDKSEERECEVGFQINVGEKRIVFSVPESSRPSYFHENE